MIEVISSDEWKETSTLLGSLERANLNQWSKSLSKVRNRVGVSLPSSEDGDITSLRNVMFPNYLEVSVFGGREKTPTLLGPLERANLSQVQWLRTLCIVSTFRNILSWHRFTNHQVFLPYPCYNRWVLYIRECTMYIPGSDRTPLVVSMYLSISRVMRLIKSSCMCCSHPYASLPYNTCKHSPPPTRFFLQRKVLTRRRSFWKNCWQSVAEIRWWAKWCSQQGAGNDSPR
jgi:hypothetical protein